MLQRANKTARNRTLTVEQQCKENVGTKKAQQGDSSRSSKSFHDGVIVDSRKWRECTNVMSLLAGRTRLVVTLHPCRHGQQCEDLSMHVVWPSPRKAPIIDHYNELIFLKRIGPPRR
jgi:hypothetical protein